MTTAERVWVFVTEKLAKAPCESPTGWPRDEEKWCPEYQKQDMWCWPCEARARLDGSWDGG